MPTGSRTVPGNFCEDFDRLLEQLGRPVVIELGKPPPQEKYLPRKSASCPAAHNRTLLGDAWRQRRRD